MSGFSPLIKLLIPGYLLISQQFCVSYQGTKGDGENSHHCLQNALEKAAWLLTQNSVGASNSEQYGH